MRWTGDKAQLSSELHRNAGQLCQCPGCREARHLLSRFCRNHMRMNALWGHPRGHWIAPKHYRPWKPTVADFLSRHRTHPGYRVAMEWLDTVMGDAAQRFMAVAHGASDKLTAAEKTFARLHRHRTTAEAILTECASIWHYATGHPNALPDDERLTYLLGYAVACLAPPDVESTKSYKSTYKGKTYTRLNHPYSGSVRREVGTLIRDTLAGFLASAVRGIDAEHLNEAQRKAALNLPFEATNQPQEVKQ